MTTLSDKAERFRSLHRRGSPLVLPNVWDALSARLVESAGAPAVATTSAGVAWSMGTADGGHLDRDSALAVVARVVEAVDVPVSADIESGFGASPDDVAQTIEGVLEAGAVGINIEDVDPDDPTALRSIDDQAERIAAARDVADEAGTGLFINARIDTFLRAVGDPGDRLPDTFERAETYYDAGADGIFVPGVLDLDIVAALADEIDAPLNILAAPGAPNVATLGSIGVARVSLGSRVAAAAYTVVQRCAQELFGAGTYASVEGALTSGDLNELMLARS
ncbi:isocitrate lyase/phosphoenolpyruvate mutase family protein [Haloactinopolyspora sp.]|uniref:isocitrate lyase/PEP mutase family protein n=1 Tax=Haloactinopolyspora sp. TaxID=1966353 RepID=UPI002609CA03|nr:isocitrate lyase/phosphoenolpyruvate mutase family protein [Haloactinopolyspora sp.]